MTTVPDTKTARCKACAAEFSDAEIEGRTSCPACGSVKSPMAVAHDVAVALNWFELRCLANWADNWSQRPDFEADGRALLQRILDKIRAVRPNGAAPLTLRDELGEMHDRGIDASLHDSEGRPLIVPPTKH